MPHVPFRVRPLPGTTPPPNRSVAPLAAPAAPQTDLPQLPDILDLPMPDAPVRADRPQVPFAAPRKREASAKPRNSMLPTISMKVPGMSPDEVSKHLFPEG